MVAIHDVMKPDSSVALRVGRVPCSALSDKGLDSQGHVAAARGSIETTNRVVNFMTGEIDARNTGFPVGM